MSQNRITLVGIQILGTPSRIRSIISTLKNHSVIHFRNSHCHRIKMSRIHYNPKDGFIQFVLDKPEHVKSISIDLDIPFRQKVDLVAHFVTENGDLQDHDEFIEPNIEWIEYHF